MDTFSVAAYWGSRRESAMACGRRLARCLAALAAVDEGLGQWFRRGRSRAAASEPVEVDGESLGKLLALGRNRRDVGREVIEELGFSVGLWNGTSPSVGLSATVGAHPSFPGMLNHLVLDIPAPEGDALRLYEPRRAVEIFRAVVTSWDPDWATWVSPSLRAAQSAGAREPVVGWMTYLSKARPVGGLGSGVDITSVDGAHVLALGPDVASVDLGAVLDLRKRLRRNGALSPIP